MELLEELERYIPYNEQEEQDLDMIKDCLLSSDDIFVRTNKAAHMTASAWVTNQNRDKILMAYHKIYDSWAWLGGHADGERDLLQVALREAKEEAGIRVVRPVISEVFSIEVLPVPGHRKNERYISSHLHLNITYLLEADELETLHIKEDENCGVKWFLLEDGVNASTEPWMQTYIYRKLIDKMKFLF